jgi:uncharacterized protein YpmS
MFEGCRGCCVSLVLVPLLFCALSVGLVIYIYATAPDPPLTDNFKAKQSEADAFDQIIDDATVSTGDFLVQFNEREISSWMTLEGQDFAEKNDRRFPFKNIQVGLDDGKMTFYAELDTVLDLAFEVVIEPEVDKNGKMEFDIDEAHLGGLRVPRVFLKGVTEALEDKLVEPFEDLGDYRITGLTVQDGFFSMNGSVLPN